MGSSVRIVDGSFDWSQGVNSSGPTTAQSPVNQNGVPRNMLIWLVNGTVRGGGITPRGGWQPVTTVHDGSALYQGGIMYDPPGDSFPYLVLSIGGRIFTVRLDTDNSVHDITASFPGTANPAFEPTAYFAQQEEFLVIQAGDYAKPGAPIHAVPYGTGVEVGTYPLFYDGVTLRRSNGITVVAANPVNELPPATVMTGFMGRIWYARGRVYSAGDIVGNVSSGTLPYNFRDSMLHVTENPLAFGGDGFTVPTNAKEIRALANLTELDQAVGVGNLYIGTRRSIFRLQVPVSRTDWIAANANNQPLQTIIQKKFGFINERSIVEHNADLFFKAMDGTRSLGLAVRYFSQWGNTAISRNERRLLDLNDRSLMRYSSGIEFDNRLLHTEGPVQTAVGAAFKAVSVLDFDLITTLQTKLPPAWEGMYEGLDILQLFEGDFGGLQRAFAVVHSRVDGSIQLWELTTSNPFDMGDRRVTMVIEWPAFNFQKDFDLRQLDGAELWIDRMFGNVDFVMQYRTDSDPCWRLWTAWQDCSARNACDDVTIQDCLPDYPQSYQESFRATKILPAPPVFCMSATKRPSNVGYQFQPRLIVKGFARIRGLMVYALPKEQAPGAGIVC